MTETLQTLGLPSQVLVWQLLLLTLLSFVVGVLGGFVGLALGTMRLPALLLLGMPAPVAAGTNILVSTLSALTGLARHFREGRVNLRVVAVMGIPALVGAFIGGFASDLVPEALLISLAGAFVLWQGVEFIVRALRDRRATGPAGSTVSHAGAAPVLSPGRAAAEAGIGLSVGLLGGAVGLILGSIRLPALIRILHMDPRVAAGTNLFIGFLMGSFGWVGHVAQGQVDYPVMVAMALSGMVGTFYGARLTGRVKLSTLILTMGWVLLAVGALLLVEAFRRVGS